MVKNTLLGLVRGTALAGGAAVFVLGAAAIEAGQWSGVASAGIGAALVYWALAWRGWAG